MHLPFEPGFKRIHCRTTEDTKQKDPECLHDRQLYYKLLRFRCSLVLLFSTTTLGSDIGVGAEILLDFPVRRPGENSRKYIGFGEGFGVFESVLHLQPVAGGAAVPLDDVQRIAMRLASAVEPRPIVESYGVDHQGIPLPSGNGIAGPTGHGGSSTPFS